MNILRLENFLDTFNRWSIKQVGYLHWDGNTFKIIYDKQIKNLNSQVIYEWSLLAFRFLNPTNQEKVVELQNSLKCYLKRLYTSKPWHWKVLSYLGIKSIVEYKIILILFSLLIYYFLNRIFREYYFVNLREYYHKVLGRGDLEIEFLEGWGAFYSIASILKDIQLFLKKEKNPENRKKIESVLNDLYFTLENINQENINQSDVSPIIEKLNQLDTQSELILGGGSTEHFVVYVIKKDTNNLYSFRIINGGDAALLKPSIYLKEFKDYLIKKYQLTEQEIEGGNLIQAIKSKNKNVNLDEVKILLKKVFNKLTISSHQLDHEKTRDFTYTKLTKEQLSKEFFDSLRNSNFKNMEETLAFIDKSLLTEDGSNFVYEGRVHQFQKNGVCSVKSMTLYLHERWGDKMHAKFKVLVTKRQNARLKKYIREIDEKQITPYLKNAKLTYLQFVELVQNMLKEGKQILKKRKTKYQTIKNATKA